tara:strand:+ start:280 stop:615 length:336 start_codon:yes stop_codon:yes gene_type:complete
MKIIVLDYRSNRHTWHEKNIKKLFPNADFQILVGLDHNGIKGCNADILIVHQGNTESSTIEDTPDCGERRIFFSGGTDTYELIDGDHYEKVDRLYERLAKILSESEDNNDS